MCGFGVHDNMTRTVRTQTREGAGAAAKRMSRVIIETKSSMEGECCICCGDLAGRSVANLPCGHALHTGCYRQLKASACASSGSCPICRAPFLDALPRWEQGGILRGILRVRLEEEHQMMADAEAEAEAEAGGEEGTENREILMLIHAPLPTAEQETALVRHLTRRQRVPGRRWARDEGAWADGELGLASLFAGLRLGDATEPATEGELTVNPLAVADGLEWEAEEEMRSEE